MGIHGFGQVNNLELQRLLAAKGIQGGQRPATASQQNVDMTRDGSIFNMATPNGVNRRGFNEQNADNSIRPQPKTQNSTQSPECVLPVSAVFLLEQEIKFQLVCLSF